MTSKVTIVDMTKGGGELKSNRSTSLWFVTTVYHRVVRRMGADGDWHYVEDYEPFKDYVDEKVREFYEGQGFRDCLTMGKDGPVWKGEVDLEVDIGSEINSKGYLHHHAEVKAEYPRMVNEWDEKRRLLRPFLDYTRLNKIGREVIDLGDIAIKIQAVPSSDNSANLRNYIRKKG